MRIVGVILVLLSLVTCPIGACVALGSSFASRGSEVLAPARLTIGSTTTTPPITARADAVLNPEVWVDVPCQIDPASTPAERLPRTGITARLELLDPAGELAYDDEIALEAGGPRINAFRPPGTTGTLRVLWLSAVPAPQSPFTARVTLTRNPSTPIASDFPPRAELRIYAVTPGDGSGSLVLYTGIPTLAGAIGAVLFIIGQVRAGRRKREAAPEPAT